MNGNMIVVYSDGQMVGAVKGNDIVTQAGVLETSMPDDGIWRTFYAARKTWMLSCNYLLLSSAGMASLLTVGSTNTLVVRGRDGVGVTGIGILVECHITAVKGNLATGSFRWQGTGALTAVTPSVEE